MSDITITREQLQEAVEVALEHAQPRLAKPDADRIREVAKTTTQFARGDWIVDGCGCPAVQAGLWRPNVGSGAPGVAHFASEFDLYIGHSFDASDITVVSVQCD